MDAVNWSCSCMDVKMNIPASRFTLKGSDDKVTSMVQKALLTAVLGRQCIGCTFVASVKHRTAEVALMVIDTGIQLLSLQCCCSIH